MSTEVGSLDPTRVKLLGDFAGRATLVAVFSYLATTQTLGVIAVFGDPAAPHLLDLSTRLAGIAYLVLVVLLAVVRLKPPIRTPRESTVSRARRRVSSLVALVALPLTDIGTGLSVTSLDSSRYRLGIVDLGALRLGCAFSIMAQALAPVTTGPYAIVASTVSARRSRRSGWR